MKCKKCGEENALLKRCCSRCGAFLEGYTLNNVTGRFGYRGGDGGWYNTREEYIQKSSHVSMAADRMKKKDRMPRKLKKAMNELRIWEDTGVVFHPNYLRPYPRTKWVVRAERQFKRTWRKLKNKVIVIQLLEKELKILSLL